MGLQTIVRKLLFKNLKNIFISKPIHDKIINTNLHFKERNISWKISLSKHFVLKERLQLPTDLVIKSELISDFFLV